MLLLNQFLSVIPFFASTFIHKEKEILDTALEDLTCMSGTIYF